MSFTPYTTYRVHYPSLKPGYLMKIGDKFYMVITVRENRKTFQFTTAQTKTPLAIETATPAGLESMTGKLTKNRVVHLQYVGIDAGTPTLYWGTEPLLSKDVEETIDATRAGISNPIAIDRWSYDDAMRLLLTQAAVTINYYFQIMEYEVVPYEGTPTRPYLHLMSNGQAMLVESEETAKTVSMLGRTA